MTTPAADRPLSTDAILSRLVAEGDMVLDRLDAAAAAQPEKPFIVYGEDDLSLSYAAFRDRTDRLAAGLAGLGIGPDDPVSVFTKNSLVAAIAMFAIWRAGGVYAPVNYNYFGPLLAYQLADTAPKVILTDLALADILLEALPPGAPPAIVVHRPRPGDHDHAGCEPAPAFGGRQVWDLADLLGCTDAVPRVPRGPADTANIIYTSGTTGPSKGVVQPFRWINGYGFGYRALTDGNDVVYCDLPMYHVGGAFFLLTRAAWHGGTVGLWDRFSPGKFWERIARCGATTCVLLDVMVPWLMSAEPSTNDRANTLNKVHMQPLPGNSRGVAERFGFDLVTSGFGQTETGMGFIALIDHLGAEPGTPPDLYRGLPKAAALARAAALGFHTVGPGGELPRGLMGRPSPWLEAAILDEDDRPCGPDEVGQLAFRPRFPALVLAGYLNKPDVTLKAFRNLWFHTGDACRRDPDGVYSFVDRLGGYLRVRGENISSFQVEDLVNAHPKVRVAAAFPVPAREGNEDDVAVCVELVEGKTASEADIRAHCEAVMPRYMRPRHVRVVDRLPLTPTGKIEKYKLRNQLVEELGRTEVPR